METITEEKIEKVLYYRNAEAENKIKSGAEAAAQALNNVYKHFKFKNISEIPGNVQEWITRRTLETNPELAKLTQTHKLESLKYEVPAWIREAGNAFSNWNSVKNSCTQFLQYCALVDEKFVVDFEMLEQEFDNSEVYRKYFKTEAQLKRLNQCRRFIAFLNENDITYPGKYMTIFKLTGNPWCRVIGDKYVPCLEFVLNAEVYPTAPMARSADYILESILE